ncbi:leucine-rich repeat protein [Skeletonema marinoi]|uniref:Leucine-rich repeat protein n=1 Tax=Skeletonema marinoi TaxID=267567 RepID=A0AAD8Y1F1_9STRA|nr:leucine-rich repeat protein [Skeletonema marinoi]
MVGSLDYAYYKEHAQDVKLDDITSSERNKSIMQKLRDGNSDFKDSLYILDEPMEDDDCEFIVQQSDDLGWLGYFVGENKRLGGLFIKCYLPPGTSFVEGFCRNRSIQFLDIECDIGDYLSLASLVGNNIFLDSLEVGCIGNAHDFAVALGQRSHLKCLHFENLDLLDDLSDEEMSGIAQALSAQPQLEDIRLESIGLEGNGWAALSTTFMAWGRNSKLKKLDLSFNDIDDEGLQSLLRGIANCRNLVELRLIGNNQITLVGLRALSGFFQSESCRLESLNLDRVDVGNEGAIILATGLVDYKLLKHLDLSGAAIGDEGMAALVSGLTTAANTGLETLKLSGNSFTTAGIRSLSTLIQSKRSTLTDLSIKYMRIDYDGISILADALTHNTSLESLFLDPDGSIYEGSNIFSRLLCDTSSINNIYLSNHTLQTIGWSDEEVDRGKYFDLNRRILPNYRYIVPMCKILTHHPDLADMKPFYQWKLKILPLMVKWFQRASPCQGYFEESAETFQSRELSAMYRFIRGVPLLVADGFWSQQLKQVRVKKRKLEEEEEQLLKRLGRGKRVSM